MSCISHNAPGVDPQAFVVQLLLHNGPAGMQEGHSIPPESLKDEPFSPEEIRSKTLVERNRNFSTT